MRAPRGRYPLGRYNRVLRQKTPSHKIVPECRIKKAVTPTILRENPDLVDPARPWNHR
jgi:hypothetical protein